MATPIFEQRTLVLILRNHSAVPTSFSLKVRVRVGVTVSYTLP